MTENIRIKMIRTFSAFHSFSPLLPERTGRQDLPSSNMDISSSRQDKKAIRAQILVDPYCVGELS